MIDASLRLSQHTLLFILLCVFGSSLRAQSNTSETDSTIREVDTKTSPWSFGGFPIILYSAETRLAIGGGAQLVHRPTGEAFASALSMALYYSQNKQYNIGIGGQFYLNERRQKITVEAGHVFWPDKFYGVGNNTKKEDEEGLTVRRSNFRIAYQYLVFADLLAGIQYSYAHAGYSDFESTGALAAGNIFGSIGGSVSSAGIVLTWDSRDNNLYPTEGGYHQLMTFHGMSFLGGDYSYDLLLLDTREFLSVFDDHVLAFRAVAWVTSGERPLFTLARLGEYLRGYFPPRFLDKDLLAVQAEYRMPVIWRFGAVAFAGFGQVANGLRQFALSELKPSIGFGIRFALIPDQKVNLRIDFGIGKGDGSMDINLLETF